jgi:hypothetical protein
MERHKFWLLNEDPINEPLEVKDIDINKASIIYFSGVGDFIEAQL